MYTLAYTDDIVLLAKEEEGMRAMMAGLERYIKGKKLEVNVGKSKIMRLVGKGEEKEDGMVVGGERGEGDKGIEIFGVYFSEEQ